MLGKKIAYNTIIAAGGRVFGLTLSLITIGLITRYLGETGFGFYTTIVAFLYFFTVLSDLGLYAICVRDISKIKANERKIASNAFTIRFFGGLFFFALAPVVAYFFPYAEQVKTGILIAGAGFWLMSNQQVLIGVFQKYLKVDKIALAEVLSKATQLGLVAFFIWQGLGFLFIVSAIVGAGLVNFLLVFGFSQKYVPISFEFDFVFWKDLLKKSLPLALAVVFTAIYFKIDTVMLSLMKPAAHVGIYGLGYRILESLLFFPVMFVGLVMPLMSKYVFTDKAKFIKITQEALNVLLILIVPMIVGTFILSDKIINIIGGEGFSGSALVLNILIIAASAIFLGALFSNMIISFEKQKKLTYIYGFGVVINLIANFLLIPDYTYYGAALATVMTEVLATALMVWVIYKQINVLLSFKSLLKYIIAGLFMGLVLYFLNFNLFVSIILGMAVYFGVLYLIGGISKEEIKLLKSNN
jgi:O-antigen/teichoic acid export membrane protein